MSDPIDFEWTFPCFAVEFGTAGGTLAVALVDGMVAIFTDEDLAIRFRDENHPTFHLLRFQDRLDLIDFLELVSGRFAAVAVDPTQKKTRFFGLRQAVEQLLAEDS